MPAPQSDTERCSPPWKRILLLLLTLAAIFTAYSPALSGGFVWDDRNLIERSPSVHQLKPFTAYFRRGFWDPADQPSRTSAGYYRPLTLLSYAAEWQLWRGAPSGFHLTNLLLHLANCLLLFLLARRLGARFHHAVFGMALFGLMPRLSESVAWISGRTDALALLFVLGALLAYPRVPAPMPPSSNVKGLAFLRTSAAALLVLLGLFCKETALAGAFALAAAELGRLLRKETSLKGALGRLTPLLAALLAYAALRLAALDGNAAQDFLRTDLGDAPPRLLTVLAAAGSYVRMTVLFPWPELQIGSINLAPLPMVLLGAAAVSAALALLLKFGPRRAASHPLFPLAVLALIALLPVLHIVPLKLRCLTADRFLYVPSAAFAVCLAAELSRHPAQGIPKVFARAVAALVLCLCLFAALLQAERWSSERSLFQWGCAEAPEDNAAACLLLATALIDDGQPKSALEAYDKAERLERRANPGAWSGYSLVRTVHGRALAWTNLGRHREAIEALERLSAQVPSGSHAVKTHSLTAMSWLRLGEVDKAREVVRRHLLPMRNGPLLSASFEQLAGQVQTSLTSLGDALREPVGDLDDGALLQTARFARLLNDRFRLTQTSVEVLRRGTLPPEVREEAARWLEASGICGVLAQAFGGPAGLPPRCVPPPTEVWE